MKVISSFITKGSISRKVVGKKPNGKSYLPDVLKEQIPAILKALNASVARQTKKNFFDTKVTLLYDNLIDEDIDNAETSINFDIDGYNKSDGNVADLDDIFDEISYKTIKADVNKVLKNGVKVLDVYDGGYLGSIIEFKVSKPKKVTSSLKQTAQKETSKISHPWGWGNVELIEDREGGMPVDGSQAVIKIDGKEVLTFTYSDVGKKGDEFYATNTKIKNLDAIADLLVAFINK